MTPLQIIRRRCLECVVYPSEITKCSGRFINGETCALHPYRFGKKPADMKSRPLKAIRTYCLWCMGGSATEVRLCGSGNCALIDWRFGRNLNLKHEMTPSRRNALAKARENLSKTRASANENSSKTGESIAPGTGVADPSSAVSRTEKPDQNGRF